MHETFLGDRAGLAAGVTAVDAAGLAVGVAAGLVAGVLPWDLAAGRTVGIAVPCRVYRRPYRDMPRGLRCRSPWAFALVVDPRHVTAVPAACHEKVKYYTLYSRGIP